LITFLEIIKWLYKDVNLLIIKTIGSWTSQTIDFMTSILYLAAA